MIAKGSINCMLALIVLFVCQGTIFLINGSKFKLVFVVFNKASNFHPKFAISVLRSFQLRDLKKTNQYSNSSRCLAKSFYLCISIKPARFNIKQILNLSYVFLDVLKPFTSCHLNYKSFFGCLQPTMF